jgi:hypothetical protein
LQEAQRDMAEQRSKRRDDQGQHRKAGERGQDPLVASHERWRRPARS